MHLSLKDTNTDKLHIDKMWALFVGRFNDNVMHRHYALQISISQNRDIKITNYNHEQKVYTSCLINSNIPHQFQSEEISLIILINPLSGLGYQLYKKYSHTAIVNLDEDFKSLSVLFLAYLESELVFPDLVQHINVYFKQLGSEYETQNYFSDERIYGAIQYLEQHFDRIVSLEEIAGICYLSQTRFLHLFKEKTGLNFRRYQLWNKLIKSLPYLKEHTITEAAHQFGFTDSSHYTRTFKETFGLSPKILKLLK